MDWSNAFGFVGTMLVAAAYIPQITHLIKEHCSDGVSLQAFFLWTLSSLLFLLHAIAIRDTLFTLLQSIQLVATLIIVIYTKKYANQFCASHRPLNFKANISEL